MAQVSDAQAGSEGTPSKAHVHNIDQADAVVGGQNHVAEMDRSEVNALLVEKRKENSQAFRQLGIHLGFLTTVPKGYTGQNAVMHGGPLDRRYTIKRCNRNGWYTKGFDPPNIALEAFGMRKEVCGGQHSF